MAGQDAKQFMDRYYAAIRQSKSPEVVDQWVADESLKQHIAMFEAAFPGYDLIVEDMVAESDTVALRAVFTGRHEGEFQGIPATGRDVRLPLMLFYRIENDKIAQFWMSADRLALLEQLGKAPVSV